MSKFRDGLEWLVLGLIITAAAATVPDYALRLLYAFLPRSQSQWLYAHLGSDDLQKSAALLFSMILVLPAPVRAGLVLPSLRGVWWRVAIFCGTCISLAAIFSSRLNMPELRGTDHGYWMWLIGPPAEDLVFSGFLFGKFDQLWPGPIARWLPVHGGVLVSACYFSLWHAQNFASMDSTFVCQQMAFTFAGGIVLGLTRQWTGSILFVTLTHMIVNFIAWTS